MTRFERVAFRLGGERSILLSYKGVYDVFYPHSPHLSRDKTKNLPERDGAEVKPFGRAF